MTHIQGVGGMFIYSSDANALADRYQNILEIPIETHPNESNFYHVFKTKDPITEELRHNPVFAIQQISKPEHAPAQGVVINFRVDDMDATLQMLAEKGIVPKKDMLVWEGGKHTWIKDPDGNTIELYEEIFFEAA